MKKKNIILIILLVMIILPISYNCLKENTSVVLKDNKKNNYKTSTISMMYETSSGSGEYAESSDSTWNTDGYVFNATLSKCENDSTLSWNGDTASVVFKGNMSDKCYVYFDLLPPVPLSDYIKGLYTSDGTNGLYYHDGKGSYTNASYEAGDNSYRYSGANPNNYVCFGSTASTCPTDNLYRIIGVFGDQVKLIKYDYADSAMLGTDGDYSGTGSHNSTYKGSLSAAYLYYWNTSTNTNTWSESALNTTNLNTTYTNSLGTTWTNLIETTTWKVGGNTYAKIADTTVNNTYANEITSPAATTTHSAKIGLMYVSDYGYAAAPSAWSTNLSSYNASSITSVNWMYMGETDWTISRNTDYLSYAFTVNIAGSVNDSIVTHNYAIRPSFYLKSSVAYKSGTGTIDNPIYLVVE